jgi:hypothetical protein
MSDKRESHIIAASANLLGICFVIITGLKLTGVSGGTAADELCIAASVGFMVSCISAYLSLRTERDTRLLERVADVAFLLSMLSLFVAVLVVASSVI